MKLEIEIKVGEKMKEAAGEANMTVITIVLIAIVLAVGTIIITNLMSTTAKKSACSELGGTLSGNSCTYRDIDGKTKTATCSKDGNEWVCGGLSH